MDAVHFFLTYPQSDIPFETVYHHLQSIKPVVWARVAHESHEDGSPHVHVAVRFGKRHKTSADRREFDILGRHPNVQVCRKVKDVLEYVSKGGNFQDFGLVPSSQPVFKQLQELAKRGVRAEFDECAMENRVSFMWANHIWTTETASTNTIREAGQGIECLQLQGLPVSDLSMVIIGPTGCGKSTWAKRVCEKPALWVNHLDDLKKWNPEHKSIIFDDMDFKHLPRTTQIYIADQENVRTIHCRNTNATLPPGLQKIFTCNEYPFSDDPAINRRLHVVRISSFAL